MNIYNLTGISRANLNIWPSRVVEHYITELDIAFQVIRDFPFIRTPINFWILYSNASNIQLAYHRADVITYPVDDFKDDSSRAESSGKCLQLRQSVAKREASNDHSKQDSNNITSRELTSNNQGGAIPRENT